jgi:hypothetical protein
VPTVAELMSDRADMAVQCELGDIQVTYRPRVVTPQWQKDIGDRETAGEDETSTLYRPLREAIVSWNLEYAKGTPYDLTDESLASIPRQILNQVLFSLIATARPNQQKPPILSTGGSLAPSTSMTTGDTPSNGQTGSV